MKTNTNNIEWNQDKVTTSFFPQTLTIFFLHIYLNPKIDRISMLPIGVSVNVWVLEFKSLAFLVKIRPKCKTRRRGLSKGLQILEGGCGLKFWTKLWKRGRRSKIQIWTYFMRPLNVFLSKIWYSDGQLFTSTPTSQRKIK